MPPRLRNIDLYSPEGEDEEAEFRELVEITCEEMGVPWREEYYNMYRIFADPREVASRMMEAYERNGWE